VVAYILLTALLLFVVRPGRISSYEIGRSTGLLLISILISYGIWSLIRRSRGSGARWSPWLVLIACFVATFLKVTVLPGDIVGAGVEAGNRAPNVAILTADDVFVDIPGFRYERLPPNALEQAEAGVLADPAAAGSMISIDGRLVLEGQRQVAVLTVLFSTPQAAQSEEFQSGFFVGFAESIEDQGGGPIRSHALASGTAQGGPMRQAYALAFLRENAAITVVGGDRYTAELLAEALLAATTNGSPSFSP
jgi:hypothetical protein